MFYIAKQLKYLFALTSRFSLTSVGFAAIWSLVTVLFYNQSFFIAVFYSFSSLNIKNIFFVVELAIVLFALNFIFFLLLIIPWVNRFLFSIIFICAAFAHYFMSTYGIVIHQTMIQNVFETDAAEVSGLVSFSLLGDLFFLGVLPSFFILRTKIIYRSFFGELWVRTRAVLAGLVVVILLVVVSSASFSSFFRSHREIRQLANPLNFVYASSRYFLQNNKPLVVRPIENDAHLNEVGSALTKPQLLVLVVGETARADHFQLNGYKRETTPLMIKENLINFSSVHSCGTETAVSVPCMMSLLGRKDYSDSLAKQQESVLDVISHAGIGVFWRDNNSSCKGACDRVTYENIQRWKLPDLCNKRECFDEALLFDLDKKLETIISKSGSKLLVLHPKGSHGPDYYNRYPASAEFFKPVCKTNQLQDCTPEELVNAFDNTIRYSDHFLAAMVSWLKTKEDSYNTAMIYLSDHGESLGENKIYLHGMPYMLAPEAQKHVPLFFWFSSGYEEDNKINTECLKRKGGENFSHDNLAHTLMGLMNVSSSVYSPELDIVSNCRR